MKNFKFQIQGVAELMIFVPLKFVATTAGTILQTRLNTLSEYLILSYGISSMDWILMFFFNVGPTVHAMKFFMIVWKKTMAGRPRLLEIYTFTWVHLIA